MAKVHLDRIAKRFGTEGWSGGMYRSLMQIILSENTESISNKIAKLNQSDWNKALKKITPVEKKFIMPDISSVLPKRSVFIRKGAEQGTILSDTLRDRLTKDLRDTLNQFTPKTGEAKFLKRRGAEAGKINNKLVIQFEKTISNTFKNYTKKDPKYGMPPNIHNIAVTEMRSTINTIKSQYTAKMLEENPDMIVLKQWIQNRSLAVEPRKGHGIVSSRKPIPLNKYYNVPHYIKKGKKLIRVRTDLMMHPHDPDAPADTVIGCNCEEVHIIRWKKNRKVQKNIFVEKGKKAEVGAVHTWSDGSQHKKMEDGTWEEVTEEKEKKEDEDKSYMSNEEKKAQSFINSENREIDISNYSKKYNIEMQKNYNLGKRLRNIIIKNNLIDDFEKYDRNDEWKWFEDIYGINDKLDEILEKFSYAEPAERAFIESGLYETENPKITIGWRYGNIPEGGRSHNFAENKAESGVSFMQIKDEEMNLGMAGMEHRESGTPIIFAVGYIHPETRGGDGEPLMLNPEIIEKKNK